MQSAYITRIERIAPKVLLGLMAIAVISCGGDDPVKPKPPPRITAFTASPLDILPGDSSQLAYSVQLATGLTLQPGNVALTELASGSVWVSPVLPTVYSLIASNADGTDSASVAITMSGAVPNLTSLALAQDTLLIGESTTLSWQAVRADSIVVDNGIGKLSSSTSGQISVSPSSTVTYRAIAFNQIGRDSLSIKLVVHDPLAVQSLNGMFFTGFMGQSNLTPPMTFRVVDKAGLSVSRLWIHFTLIVGDGVLSVDSLLPTTNGLGTLTYNFSGSLGHALIRATASGVDSVEVNVRANTLITGANGQGQYALFNEPWSMVKNFNGDPVADMPDPTFFIQYQDYEAQLGVVVIVRDLDQDEVADDVEPVVGVIVNTIYPHKTADSIGIGSHYDEIVAVYGTPESIIVDTTNLPPGEPPGIAYIYTTKGLTFWTHPADSTLFEFHLSEPPPIPVNGAEQAKRNPKLSGPVWRSAYRRFIAP